MGGCIVGCVATVKMQQNTKDKEWKGRLMHVHKSLALIVLGLLPLRFGARFLTLIPAPIAGPRIEQVAGQLGHLGMYAFATILPVTGAIMGYMGGKGLPFFFTHIEGAETPNKKVAGFFYKVHTWAGFAFLFVLPLHVGGALLHTFRGQKAFSRINPFLH